MESSNIKKTFGKYVALNVLGMIGLSCYILADTFFVARGLGANGLTALNLAIPIYSFINGVGLMIGMGGAIRYSISKSKTIFTQSAYLILILASLFFLVGLLFSSQLATLLGADAATHQMTSTYLQIILCFSPMFMLNNLIICFVRNDGDPKLSMIAMLLGSFSNIILDYVFIFPFKMGMFGAALATGIAPVISLIVLSLHIIKKRNSFKIHRVKPHIKAFCDVSLLGMPSLITEFSSGIVIIIFNGIILGLAGNLGVAAYGIIANIALVVIAIFTGISQGMQPIISKNHGSGNNDNVKKVLRYGITVSIVFALVIYIVSFIFAEPIVSVFNKDQNLELAKTAVDGLRIYFTAFVFVGINVLTATYFSSIDKPRNAFSISLLRGFVVVIPTAFIMSSLFGITGVWLTITFTEIIVLFVSLRMLKK